MAHYIDTWHVEANRTDGAVITCYGLTERQALSIAEELQGLLSVISVVLVHTIRPTQRGRWDTQKFQLRPR